MDVSAPFPEFALYLCDRDGCPLSEREEFSYVLFCGGEGSSRDRLLSFIVEVSENLPFSGLTMAGSVSVVEDACEFCARNVMYFSIIICDLITTIRETGDRAACV